MIPLRILHVVDPARVCQARSGVPSLLPWLTGQGHAMAVIHNGTAESVLPGELLGRRTGWWAWWRRERRSAIAAAGRWGADLVHVHGEAGLSVGIEVARAIATPVIADPSTISDAQTMRLLRDPAVTALLVPGEEHRARALADVHLPRDRVIVLPPGIDGGSPQARAVDGSLVVGARVRRRIDLIILLRGLAIARRGLAISALVAPCGLPQALVAEMTASVGLPAEAVRTVGLGDEIVGSDVAIELDATDIALHHLVDALAAGRPVIAVSEGALPELVVDGRSGVLVPVRDAEALAAALRQLAAADRRSTLAAGAIQAARRFSVSLTGEVLLGVYRAAVGGASAGGATTWRRLSAERTTSPRTTSLDAAASPPSSAARGATQRHV